MSEREGEGGERIADKAVAPCTGRQDMDGMHTKREREKRILAEQMLDK